jgi:cobalt-zinc-cadmium efflux system protein
MHEHGHTHAPRHFDRAFGIGIGLNVLFVVAEVIFGVIAGSLALLADAGHNLSDILSLFLAWGAGRLARRAPTKRRTYGMRRTTILASLLNAIILLIAVGAIAWEAVRRFAETPEVSGPVVMIVAGIGVLINGVTALLFFGGRKHDLNIKGAFLHMAADAAVSLGVVVAGLIIHLTGAAWIDPVVSLVIVVVIGVGTWGLLRDSFNLALDAVPEHIDPADVRAYLEALPEVSSVHDLHIWAMSTTEVALTAHLVRPEASIDDPFLARVSHELYDRFGIEHVTIQVEHGRTDVQWF